MISCGLLFRRLTDMPIRITRKLCRANLVRYADCQSSYRASSKLALTEHIDGAGAACAVVGLTAGWVDTGGPAGFEVRTDR